MNRAAMPKGTTEPKRYPDVVIRASAGTGKTFQLSNRYLSLLRGGAPADQILATTFTLKAAGEILKRILLRLSAAAVDDRQCAELAEFLQDGELTRSDCLHLLEGLTRNLHRLRVSTLDGFFSQIATSFSLELGLSPGWQIVDDLTDAKLRSRAIDAILRRDATREIVRLMNLLTQGEAERSVSELLRSTVKHLYGLYQETAAEAWQTIPQPTPMSAAQLAQTIEELRNVSLPDDARFEKARQTEGENAAAGDWEAFISKGLAVKVLNGETKYYRKTIEPDVQRVYKELLRHARGVILNQLAEQTIATHELLAKFDVVYRRLKSESQVLRFEDVTRLLSKAPKLGGVAQLAFRLDARIAHLLLDEFQDTSLTQWQVMRPFAEQVASGSPAKSFFCVGDVKQAIYGWRGGIAEIFDALEGHFEGLTRETLNHSFRSAKPVIDTVNQIFSGIVKHPHLDDLQEAVQNWSDRFKPQTTSKDKLPGYTCLITAPQAAQDEKQINITLAFSAECIAEIVQQAPGHSVGVLVRTNTAVAQLIFELRRLGVPASEEGGRPLTDSAAVGVVTSLLRMADHPGDTVARFHVSHSPLGQVVGFSDDQDDVAAHRLAQQVRRTLLADGYGPTVGAWVREMAASVNQRDLSRLNQLVELAYGYEPTATLRTTDFVNYVESERVSDPTSDNVRVMTIHQAKGLQFDVVVLADLDSNLIRQRNAFVTGHSDPTLPVNRVCPYRNTRIQSLLPDDLRQMFRRATHRAVTESLCVLYVALTRAVHALHLIISPSKDSSSSKEGKQKLPKSAAGLLRAALTDGGPIPPTTTLFEEGDDEWFVQSNRDRPTAARQADAEPLEVRLAGRTHGRTRGLERATPSGREGGTRVHLANVLRLGNERALERGTLIHAWFEQIRWLDEGRPDETVLRHIAAEIGVTGLNVDEQIQQFYDMLDSPQTARVLSRGSYHSTHELAFEAASLRFEVYNERRFSVREGDTILSGSIDRLVLMCHDDIPVAADVIDFKTDAVSADDESALAETVEYYRGQLESYRPAVAAMYGLSPERISAKLLFVGPGIVRNV